MPNKADLQEDLEISEESAISDLLDLLSLVTTDEKNNIKTISVMPLPNAIKDKAQELKTRFTNIVLNEDKGTVAILNNRIAVLDMIIRILDSITNDNNDEINKILDGTTVVPKADGDSYGDEFTSTYAKLNNPSQTIVGDEIYFTSALIGDEEGDYWRFNSDTLILGGTSHSISSNSGRAFIYWDDTDLDLYALNRIWLTGETYISSGDFIVYNDNDGESIKVDNSSGATTIYSGAFNTIFGSDGILFGDMGTINASTFVLQNSSHNITPAAFQLKGSYGVIGLSGIYITFTNNKMLLPTNSYIGGTENDTYKIVPKGWIDENKVDKTQIYNGLDKTASGFVLDARQGKALKDALDTLYSYVGYATENDSDTTINKLREVFQFLAGQLDNATLVSILAGKQALIDSNNKLDADLVDDSTATNKFVTENEKSQITTNANDITGIKDGTTLDSFADVESALALKEDVANKVTSLSSSSTDAQYPSAKAVYDGLDAITLSADNTSIDITSKVVSVKSGYVDSFFATSQEIDSMLEEVFG